MKNRNARDYLGPIAYRAVTILLPIIATALGAFVLLNFPEAHARFCAG